MRSLKGKGVGNSPRRKLISKNCRQGAERMAEYKIVPIQHVFISMFGQEIQEKVDK